MEIILLERVEKLGQMGQVVNVRPGYARNFLLPQKKALRATKANLAFFETQKAQLQAQNLERKKEAEEVGGKMKGLVVIITRQAAESGMLYGSVNGRDISDAVTARASRSSAIRSRSTTRSRAWVCSTSASSCTRKSAST